MELAAESHDAVGIARGHGPAVLGDDIAELLEFPGRDGPGRPSRQFTGQRRLGPDRSRTSWRVKAEMRFSRLVGERTTRFQPEPDNPLSGLAGEPHFHLPTHHWIDGRVGKLLIRWTRHDRCHSSGGQAIAGGIGPYVFATSRQASRMRSTWESVSAA